MNAVLKKKLENYWYYYKWHTIAGVFVLFVVLISVVQCSTRENPDTTLMLVTGTQSIVTDQQELLESTISRYTPDYNKNHLNQASIDNIDLSNTSDATVYQGMSAKLMAELSTADEILMIVDDGGYKTLKQYGVLGKINTIVPNAKTTDDYRIKLSDLPAFQGSNLKTLSGSLYIVIRAYKGTTIDSSKNIAYYNLNVTILKNLVNGTQVSSASSAAASD